MHTNVCNIAHIFGTESIFKTSLLRETYLPEKILKFFYFPEAANNITGFNLNKYTDLYIVSIDWTRDDEAPGNTTRTTESVHKVDEHS